MSRKRKLWWLGMAGLVVVTLAAGGFVLLKHEPRFYRQCLTQTKDDSKELSKEFVGQMATLLTCLLDGKGPWNFTFTQDQLNSYFVEDFIGLGEAAALRKHGIHEPRLVFEDKKLRLAFRYGSGPLATVVSYDLRIWVAPKEVNVLAVEILAKRVGAIPITSQSLLEEISEVVRGKGIDVTWYRRDSNPVALIRFQGDRPRGNSQLLQLSIRPGSLFVAGRSGVGEGHSQLAPPLPAAHQVTSAPPEAGR